MTRVFWNTLVVPRNVVVAFLQLYRRLVSPLYGDVCRYYPSCSHYAMHAYQQRGVVLGTALTAWRLVRCNPWSRGGVDDVPGHIPSRLRITRLGFVAFNSGRA